MDAIDRKIADALQRDGRLSNAEVGKAAGVSTSTANERIRRLASTGVIKQWRAVLDPDRVGAGLCALLFVDVAYEGEDAFRKATIIMDEIQEIHHVTGTHSYFLKVRTTGTKTLQGFLQEKLKVIPGVTGTETLVVLETVKETTVVAVPDEERS